jgi:hypothetical protein
MPRSIQITLSSELTDTVLERLRGMDGVVGLARSHGTSIDPPGDQIVVLTNNESTRKVFGVLEEVGLSKLGGVLTVAPSCLTAPGHQSQIYPESNETVWEEMSSLLEQDSNIGLNYLVLMGVAGAVAAAGMWSDALHLVIGAMVIAPAFEPLLRIPFGLIAGPGTLAKRAVPAIIWGYLALAAGGLVTALALQTIDPEGARTLGERRWVQNWSTFSAAGTLASVFGAVAGPIVVCGLRSVLTTGVMITMALIPSMALVGMGAATGHFELATRGFTRWSVDAALVLVIGGIVLVLKRALLHRRRAWRLS